MTGNNLLSVQTHVYEDIGYIELSGRLVAESRFDFKNVLRDWQHKDPRRVLVVLHNLEYIDSAGLAALIGGWKKFRELGGELVLADINPQLGSLFEVSSINKFFRIFGTAKMASDYLKTLPPIGEIEQGADAETTEG